MSNFMFPKKKRVALVTGGAGFLGSHLVDRLLAQGKEVLCIDNFQTGRRENLPPETPGWLTIIDHDIVDPLPTLPRVDEIYNLACPASPIHYQEDPVATLQTCSTGVLHVAELAKRDRARIFHSSTSEIYGDPEVHPQVESYHGNVNTVGPRSCYDEGKRFAETLLTDYCAQYGLTLRMARIFNTYGPRMQPDDGRVISNFIMQALKGEPITLYGDGLQTRSFCYVDDLIDGFLALMVAEDIDGPVNLGNPNERTVTDLAHVIVEMVGSSSDIVHRPLPIDDPHRRKPDITLAEEQLGWSPKIDLVAGLEATIAYFRKELAEKSMIGARLATKGLHETQDLMGVTL